RKVSFLSRTASTMSLDETSRPIQPSSCALPFRTPSNTGERAIGVRSRTRFWRSNRSIQMPFAGQTASKSPLLSATARPISSDPIYSNLQAMRCALQKSCTIGSRMRFSEPEAMVNCSVGPPQPASRPPSRPTTTASADRRIIVGPSAPRRLGFRGLLRERALQLGFDARHFGLGRLPAIAPFPLDLQDLVDRVDELAVHLRQRLDVND